MSITQQRRIDPRYAHSEGHTDLCFSDDGNYIITCGSEGDIRIWKGIEDDDPTDKCVGEKAFAVAQKDDKLYVGSDHNNVQIFKFPEMELDGILTRFTAPVTTICVSVDGMHVAAGSCDMEIHLVEVSTLKVAHFVGHKAPILHVAVDPKLEYLASSSCDGTVRLWQVNDQSVVKVWSNVVTKCNSFESTEAVCHVSWEPQTGRLFAIPFPTEIKIFQRSTWNVMMTLMDTDTDDKFGLTSWSSCGRFLAASTLKGKIIVWNTLLNRIVSSSSDPKNLNICALSWNPCSELRQIAFCDVTGQLAVTENCFLSPESASVNKALIDTGRQESSNTNKEIDFDDDIDIDMDQVPDDDPDAISLDKIKSSYNSFIEGDDLKDTEDDGMNSVKSYPPNVAPLPVLEIQAPFQPTSTPIHLQRRFMVFNDVGYVRQTNTEEENMIDVDFHDISIHHAFRINNLLRHILAALSSEVLVLACEKTEDSSSKVVCRLLNSWDDSKEWSIEMTEEESVEAIAVGNKWIAVVTNFWFLRIFSLSGNQRDIINLPGPILCMNGSNNYLFVVYHIGPGLPESQNLGFQVFKIEYDVTAITPSQLLPISPQTCLKWIGFSDEYNPCILDSSGILKLYSYKLNTWRPICNVDEQWKGLSNHHFVIGVSEEMQNIRCIVCKGSYYPTTTPHPFITEISWKVPVCESSIEKGIHEEKLWRGRIARDSLSSENKDLRKELFGTALKLFALSCQTSHEMRAFELCSIMNSPEFTEFASKYAAGARNNLLVDRLSDLRQQQLAQANESLDNNFSHRYNNYKNYNGRNEPAISRNGYGEKEPEYSQSQDLFPESRDSQESISEINSEPSGSLIMEMKKKKKTLSEQKNQVIPRKKINPFRKGLQPNSNDISTFETQSSNTLSSVPLTNKENKNIANITFAEWFKNEKSNLLKEFPNLEGAELTKTAINMFKSLKTNDQLTENTDIVETNSEQSEEPDKEVSPKPQKEKKESSPKKNTVAGKKRKSLEEENKEEKIEKRKAYFKLQGFAFKK